MKYALITKEKAEELNINTENHIEVNDMVIINEKEVRDNNEGIEFLSLDEVKHIINN